MSERIERVVLSAYNAVVVAVMVAALMLSFGPDLGAALLALVAADQARLIAALAGWSLAVAMGVGGLLLLRWTRPCPFSDGDRHTGRCPSYRPRLDGKATGVRISAGAS